MLSAERIETIVSDHTKDLPTGTQAVASDLLADWQKGATEEGKFCDHVEHTLRGRLSDDELNIALAVFRNIQRTILIQATSAVREEHAHRRSVGKMARETQVAFELIQRIGRGVVFYGS
ncbi:MAG: hypothetical protein WCX61_04925, partial [Candidatus Peribacteraceae bacterium]